MSSKKDSLPWAPAEYDASIVTGLQQMAAGTCSEHLQKKVLNWIITDLCKTYDMSFRPEDLGGRDATVFAEAKRFIGNQIVKMLRLDSSVIAGSATPKEQG